MDSLPSWNLLFVATTSGKSAVLCWVAVAADGGPMAGAGKKMKTAAGL
ncbi:hypothetical protein WN943_022812 [Citrus x changshan-huyou]